MDPHLGKIHLLKKEKEPWGFQKDRGERNVSGKILRSGSTRGPTANPFQGKERTNRTIERGVQLKKKKERREREKRSQSCHATKKGRVVLQPGSPR